MKSAKNILFSVLGFMTWLLPLAAGSQTPAGVVITNTAYVSYDGGAGVVFTMPSDTVSTTVSQGSLIVTKVADRTEVGPGDSLVYTITARNMGVSAMNDVAIQDSLPRMLSFINAEPPATLDERIITWIIPRIEPGESIRLLLTCLVGKTNYEESIVNSILYSEEDGVEKRSYPSSVIWKPWAEATLEKTVSPHEGYIGDTLTYVLYASNIGPLWLTQVIVSDTLPEGIDFISAGRDVEVIDNILNWKIASLSPGETISLEFSGQINHDASGDYIWNEAILTCDENARDTASVSVRFLGQGVGIEIIKEAADSVYTAGDTLTYDLILSNSGVRDGYSIVVKDTLSSYLRYISSSHEGETEGQIVTWNLARVPAGYHDTLRVKTAIRVPIPDQTLVDNVVWAYSSEGSQDSSYWKIRVISQSDAEFTKSVNRSEGFVGDTLVYTLEARNTGSTLLSNVQVVDNLPEEVMFVSANASVEMADGVLTWNIDNLNYRETRQLQYRVVVSEAAADSIINHAVLSCQEGVLRTASASVLHGGEGAGIKILKEASSSLFNAGDTLTYDLIIWGSRGHSGYSIEVRDTLSPDLEYVGSSHQGIFGNQIVSWNLEAPVSGYYDTLHVTAAIRTPIEDQTIIENVVWANSSEGGRDSSLWTITVASLPDLTLDIQGPETAAPGDTILYTLIYSNIGSATAFTPVLRDTIPSIVTFVNASGTHSYDSTASAVEWQLPSLAPGDKDTLSLYVRINEGADTLGQIQQTAWLSYLRATTTVRMISTCTTTLPFQIGTLFVYTTVDQNIGTRGDTLTYQIVFGCQNGGIRDTVHILDYLPKQVNPIEELSDFSKKIVSYNPFMNEFHFVLNGLSTHYRDSITVKAKVEQDLDPGVVEIENSATIWAGPDTASTAEDKRTKAKTRLVTPFLSVKKIVNRKVTEVGDVLTYTVSCQNMSPTTSATDVELFDLLPEGFRYQKGTSMLDSAKIGDPRLSDTGKQVLMHWSLADTLGPSQIIRVKYRVIIGLGTKRGEHLNLANATAIAPGGIKIYSEQVSASVLVRQSAFDDRGLIIGKVFEDNNLNGLHDQEETPLKDVELILEDGTRVKTDAFGKYSIPDVESGQHVLRLNEKTLPKGKQALCNDYEFLGDAKSRLILVPVGGISKANFPIGTGQ